MKQSDESMNADIERLELQKNDFYLDHYRRTLGYLMILVVVGLCLTVFLAYFVVTEPKAKYYATTTTGQVIPMQSLSAPVVTNNYLLQWATFATRACYNLDFVNYPKQLQAASAYFTPSGWTAFMNAVTKAGVINSLQKNKLQMSAVVDVAPVIFD